MAVAGDHDEVHQAEIGHFLTPRQEIDRIRLHRSVVTEFLNIIENEQTASSRPPPAWLL